MTTLPAYLPSSDPANADESDGVMIALLPITTDWSKLDFPHMTLVYCGTKDELKPGDFNEMAKDASMLASLSTPLTLSVIGIEPFGERGEVDVLRLQPSLELLAMRRVVEDWNASVFPFKPHATIGPHGTPLDITPRALAFDRVCVSWGDENLTFRLKGSSY